LSISNWTEENLQGYIQNNIQESLTLDYKQSDSLENNERNKNEISKDVSAFANSVGGIIIYGIEESGHLPTRLDGGIDPTGKREWLEQVIDSRIHPRINGIIIKQIDISTVTNRAAFAVEIPASTTAHQAHDRKYYRRFNFRSVPMYDYGIRMVMNRVKEPILDLHISTTIGNHISLPVGESIQFVIDIENSSKVCEKTAFIELFMPPNCNHNPRGNWESGNNVTYQGVAVKPFELFLDSPEFPPLYPHRRFTILSPISTFDAVNLEVDNLAGPSMNRTIEKTIFYTIYSEKMSPKKGKVIMRFSNSWLDILKE
jgi:hypothetical protein